MRTPILALQESELLARLPDDAPRGDAPQAFRFENAAKDEADLTIYDVVWPWEPKRLLGELRALKAKTINLRINSPGGNVFGGVAIYNALVQHSARVVTHVDGVAASIASVIAMAGDEIRMGTGAQMMIHEAHAFTGGTAKELRKTADLLDQVTAGIADVYVARTGKTQIQILELMAETTWMNADQAIKEGFADTKSERPAAAAKNTFDVSIYAHAPAELIRASGSGPRPRPETKRELEAFLRDEGGFSHAAAKAIVASGFRDADPEPRDEDGEGVIAAIEASIAKTRLALALTR